MHSKCSESKSLSFSTVIVIFNSHCHSNSHCQLIFTLYLFTTKIICKEVCIIARKVCLEPDLVIDGRLGVTTAINATKPPDKALEVEDE